MSQSYLNCPTPLRAISAEEFAAQNGGCGNGCAGQNGGTSGGQQGGGCCQGNQTPAPCCCPPAQSTNPCCPTAQPTSPCCCQGDQPMTIPSYGPGAQVGNPCCPAAQPTDPCCCQGNQPMTIPSYGQGWSGLLPGQTGPGPVTGGTGLGCGCQDPCQCVMCCCRPVCPPAQPVQVQEGCCCKQSFRAALQLLCNPVLSALLDFSSAAFVTDGYTAGAALDAPAAPGTAPADNLAADLTGVFRRFTPCNQDLLDITAPVYQVGQTVSVFTASQMSLCALDALAIQAIPGVAEGDLTAPEVAARNFRTIQAVLTSAINPCGCALNGGQDACCCTCDDGECCCAKGLLNTLSQGNLSRQVSLVAGPLVLTAATLLGSVGNVLVLANDTDDRIYFVCVNSVQFLA